MTHDVEGLDEMQDAAERHLDAIGYVTLNIVEPWKQVKRLDWTPQAFADAGYCDAKATIEDLPAALVRFAARETVLASTAGVSEQFRLRLYPPKGGNALAQPNLKTVPVVAQNEPFYAAEPERTAFERALSMMQASQRAKDAELQAFARFKQEQMVEIIAGWRELSKAMGEEARENRLNVRSLFEFHIKREIGIVEEGKRRLEVERAAAQAQRESGEDDIVDDLSKLGMKLLVAAKGLPPELGEALAESPELLDMLHQHPSVLRKLRDPKAREALIEILHSLPDEEAA